MMKRLGIVLFWLSCSSAPTNPAPSTSTTLTPTKPTSEVASPKASQPATTQGAALAAPSMIDTRALAKCMLSERNVVVYSSSQRQLAFVETYTEEGNGAGMSVAFLSEEGKRLEEAEVYLPGEDEEAKIKAALPALEEKLSKGQFAPLERTDWPKGKETITPFEGLEVRWKANELSAIRAGEGKNTQTKKIPKEKPFTVSPLAAHTLKSSPVLVVQLDHDPGSAYGEGFNVFTSYEILPLPQVPSH